MTKWSGALAAIALASCVSAPAPEQQATRLIAQMKAAYGGAKLDTLATYDYTGKHVRDGKINVDYEAWGDLRTMANVQRETSQGVTVTGGYDGKVGWNMGLDGKVRVQSDPKKLQGARFGAYANTYGFLFPERFPATFESLGRRQADGKAYDVLKITPQGALSFELWLDPQTHLAARIVASEGTESAVAQFQDYQTVNGMKLIRRGIQTMKMGAQTHTETTDIATFRFEPVPPERFAPPK